MAGRADGASGPAIWDWTDGIHGNAGAAVGLGRLGPVSGGAGLVGRGVGLLDADGLGDGVALLVADGVGDGVVVGVADRDGDGVGDAVAVGVPDGEGDGSALGVALGPAVGDWAVGEADDEGLGSADALAGRMKAPAMMTPRTARTAVRTPTNIRTPSARLPGHTAEAMTKW